MEIIDTKNLNEYDDELEDNSPFVIQTNDPKFHKRLLRLTKSFELSHTNLEKRFKIIDKMFEILKKKQNEIV